MSKQLVLEEEGDMRSLLTRAMAEAKTALRQERRQEWYDRRGIHVRMQNFGRGMGERNPKSAARPRVGLYHDDYNTKGE